MRQVSVSAERRRHLEGNTTWVPHVVHSSGDDGAQQLQICQLPGDRITGQQPAERLHNICRMYAIVVWVVTVGSFDRLQGQ